MESTQLPHDNISWRIWVGTTTTVVPATLAVTLRFTARYVSRAGFWWDDYTILVALVSDPRTPNASEWKMADS
jgi:hypothetical protein